ncbi:MAG: penicillin-binding protein 2 [Ideonella sp.]|nr:penicillin-binding protein 2 [Ideonella sp.]
MTELRDPQREWSQYRLRLLVAAVAMVVAFALLGARLVQLQVVRHEELSTQAEANRIAVVPIVPTRGMVTDRNGVVLASNYAAYTLEITRGRVTDLERTIDELAELVEITPRDRRRFKRLLEDSKSFEPLPIRTRLSDAEVARFTAQRFRFPGVDIRARLFREYPLGETASHLLGYIGRISAADKRAMEDWEDERLADYRGTDVIGKLGIEQRYEEVLHGRAGYEEVEISAAGRPVRRLRSQASTPGQNVRLTIDVRLQALVEQMFGDRRGALVAIDPRNGEVLAFVSKPTFDPNLFVDGIDVESWRELNENVDRPLLNRALRGTYPPGSTFKPFVALAALRSGVRTAEQQVFDGGTFEFGNHTFRSHGDAGLGMVDMARSIVKSSNVYYYSLAHEMGVDRMHAELSPFGFGQRTGIDLEGEAAGVLPSTEWKRRTHRTPEQQRWYAGETISLGIGQGYNHFTMLQLAHATATLAAGGVRHTPHLLQELADPLDGRRQPLAFEPQPSVDLDPRHVAVIHRALHGVTVEGTATRVFAGAPYRSAGKTGTAQAVGIRQNERYDAAKLEEHLRNHSLYMAFAPLEAPTIALAVIVENAGFGAEAAAPIARRVFDYWLAGRVPSEEDLAATRVGRSAAPIGAPRGPEAILPGAGSAAVPPPAVVAVMPASGTHGSTR